MDWRELGLKWDQLKGMAKQEWGELTDDDLDYIAGTRDRLVARLQEKYGIMKEDAELQADRWLVNRRNPAA